MNCLLLRELPESLSTRLWDTYLAVSDRRRARKMRQQILRIDIGAHWLFGHAGAHSFSRVISKFSTACMQLQACVGSCYSD